MEQNNHTSEELQENTVETSVTEEQTGEPDAVLEPETAEETAAAEEADEESEKPEETEEPEETAETTENTKEKTTFFGKRKKEKEKYEQQIEELTDKLKRNMAEFDNFRKRTEKEKSSMYIIGAKEIVEKILPVVDNFERGLAQASEEDPFAEGMRMIYKQLMTTLDDLGVKPIESVNKEFDPGLHNAVMHVEDENVGDNIIVEEFQKGYTYKDFVVRHSMVKVAN